MPLLPQGLPDWRDEVAYAPLRCIERAGFAWEWLRRNPAYRDEAFGAIGRRTAADGGLVAEEPAAARWGLHAFEDPDFQALDARPVWRKGAHPPVLEALAIPWQADDDALTIERLDCSTAVVRAGEGERVLLSDGRRSIRLDLSGASLLSGPVRLDYGLTGFRAVEGPLLTLRRLLALARAGRFSRSLHPPERRAERFILMLRADDAERERASQRDIATALLSGEAREERWRVRAPSLRSRAQRLVRAARESKDGYRALLG